MNLKSLKRPLIILAFVAPIIFMFFAVKRARLEREQNDAAFSRTIEGTLATWRKTHPTRPLAEVDIGSILTNITSDPPLTSLQKFELVEAVKGFYKCYGQSSFEGFKAYRLQSPYEVYTNKLDLLLRVFGQGHLRTGNSEKDVEAVWHYYASSNIISEVDPHSVKIVVELLSDQQKGVFKRAFSVFTNANVAVLFYPQIVITHPTAHEIYQRDHKGILHATVEQYVRTTGDKFVDGSAPNPLYVSFYWSEDLHKWLPYQLAKLVGYYKTIF